INVAVMGIRNRGSRHIEGFAEVPNVRVTTLVDIDENLFANRVRFTEELHGAAPATAHDLRRVCEDPAIDAIAMATPNHWHALATVWACQAGKHVYVEKPVSHNLWEGRKMVEAARKYDRIVQVGTQSRSSQNVRDAIEFLHQGGLGEIYLARGLCIKARPTIGHFPDGPSDRGPTEDQLFGYFPEMVMYPVDEAYLKNVHYDLWLGPAPQRPFNRNRFHYNWHWQWDYGNGDIGNTGPHEFDIARWGLEKDEHPIKIRSMGGYYVFDSDQETPNTQSALYEYSDGKVLEFEVRGHFSNSESDVNIGNIFYGSEGWMALDGGEWQTYFGRNNEPGPGSESGSPHPADPAPGSVQGGHFGNFIQAIRAHDRSLLTADIEVGHRSTALAHLANVSYRVGRDVMFDGLAERFVDDTQADALLNREYREPFVVPERV
ncbi:MAG TPA: Gfo/Idh/MocA family oxidoreductase, partial [bacterium]|nr:Gfo/Idh/MocA family oxidoreductase [bacterium]